VHEKILPVQLSNGKKRFVSMGRDMTKEMWLIPEIEEIKTFYREHSKDALSAAKKEGADDIKFFNRAMKEKAVSFGRADGFAGKAIKENMFVCYYQPYFNAKDLSASGFELLLRLKDGKDKIYSSKIFTGYLENCLYLEHFKDFTLEAVLQKIKKSNTGAYSNVHPKGLERNDFMKKILFASEGGDGRLTFKISERILIEGENGLKPYMAGFKEEGVCKNLLKITMDNLAGGYSNLINLKDLPINIDMLKIGISLTKDIAKNPRGLYR